MIIGNRYLYKIGGNNDISLVNMLDLEKPTKWVSISTLNKFGQKHTINRCLLYPLPKENPSMTSEKHRALTKSQRR